MIGDRTFRNDKVYAQQVLARQTRNLQMAWARFVSHELSPLPSAVQDMQNGPFRAQDPSKVTSGSCNGEGDQAATTGKNTPSPSAQLFLFAESLQVAPCGAYSRADHPNLA